MTPSEKTPHSFEIDLVTFVLAMLAMLLFGDWLGLVGNVLLEKVR